MEAARPEVYALIMAGGGGTRLWPASRKRHPKQFLPLGPDGKTLLAATVERLGELIPAERILVVTAAEQVSGVLEACPLISRDNIVVEPEARNTSACIGLGALEAKLRDPKAVLAVLPADHSILDVAEFQAALSNALQIAYEDKVAIIGIKPTGPDTAFGYVKATNNENHGAFAVEKFVEKPDQKTAQKYLAEGHYYWNAGMFFFRAQLILKLLHQHQPELGKILDQLEEDPLRAGELYPKAPAISVDFGVMEKLGAGQVWVVPGNFGWSDVGSWNQLGAVTSADKLGNVAVGEAVTLDSKNNILYAPPGHLVATCGVEGLVVVVTDKVVMVMPKDRAQDVKRIVREIEERHLEKHL